jgi:hypothetical protein
MIKVQNPSKTVECCDRETGELCKINCTNDEMMMMVTVVMMMMRRRRQ